jgi:hypothetical protein
MLFSASSWALQLPWEGLQQLLHLRLLLLVGHLRRRCLLLLLLPLQPSLGSCRHCSTPKTHAMVTC